MVECDLLCQWSPSSFNHKLLDDFLYGSDFHCSFSLAIRVSAIIIAPSTYPSMVMSFLLSINICSELDSIPASISFAACSALLLMAVLLYDSTFHEFLFGEQSWILSIQVHDIMPFLPPTEFLLNRITHNVANNQFGYSCFIQFSSSFLIR